MGLPLLALSLYAIPPDDRQLYGVEQLFNNRKFGNLELAESAMSSPPVVQKGNQGYIYMKGKILGYIEQSQNQTQ